MIYTIHTPRISDILLDIHQAHTKEMNHADLIYYFDIHHPHTKEMNHADLNTVSVDAVASINHYYSTQRE